MNETVEATKSNGAASDFTLLVGFVNHICYFLLTYILQVICPMALAAAYFSMPQSMLAFQPSSKSFLIVTTIGIILIKVLYTISRALPQLDWWWGNIVALMTALKLEGSSLSIPDWSRRVLRRHRGQHDRNTEDVELGTAQH
jgi:hypothetical protein